MSDSEHAAKRQKQDPDAAPTTPVLIMKSEADATAMTTAAGRHLGVLPVPITANFDPERPHEVITGPFDGYPGAMAFFINTDKTGQMSISITAQPIGPEAEQMHANLKQVTAFGPDSEPATVFFRDTTVPKDHKLSKEAKKDKISEARLAAWLQDKAHTDQTSGNLKITKKVVGENGDGDKFFKCTANLCFNGPGAKGPREPKFTEAQKSSWAYELTLAVNELEKAGVEFKASPFFNLEGKRIPLAEIFSKFTTSGNGTSTAPSRPVPSRPVPSCPDSRARPVPSLRQLLRPAKV